MWRQLTDCIKAIFWKRPFSFGWLETLWCFNKYSILKAESKSIHTFLVCKSNRSKPFFFKKEKKERKEKWKGSNTFSFVLVRI